MLIAEQANVRRLEHMCYFSIQHSTRAVAIDHCSNLFHLQILATSLAYSILFGHVVTTFVGVAAVVSTSSLCATIPLSYRGRYLFNIMRST